MNTDQVNPWKSRFKKLIERADKYFEYENIEKWLNDMKGSISLTASIIATMTFSLANNPPGGLMQASLDDEVLCSNVSGHYICAGEPIFAHLQRGKYTAFLVFNTICFISSLSVILFLVSGIPINKPYKIWILSGGMSITLTSLALTNLFATNMATPNSIWNSLSGNVFGISIIVWAAIALIVYIYLIFRLFVRVVNKHFYKSDNFITHP